jgi:RNA polymerase sigma-70 factor (ECF subfamily)
LEEDVESVIPRQANTVPFETSQELSWIRASQAGDNGAFNRLVLKWERKIYNLSYRMLRHPEDAADSTQEIFLLAFRNIRKFKHNSLFSTWLYRIAVNHCIDVMKKRPIAGLTGDGDMESVGISARLAVKGTQESMVFQDERQQRIMDSLALLPVEQRIVIEMKFFQEETFEVISTILDVPQSTVKSRFYAALDILKERLGLCAEEIL